MPQTLRTPEHFKVKDPTQNCSEVGSEETTTCCNQTTWNLNQNDKRAIFYSIGLKSDQISTPEDLSNPKTDI